MQHLTDVEERISELQHLYRSSLAEGKEFAELKSIRSEIKKLEDQLEDYKTQFANSATEGARSSSEKVH